MHRLAFPCCLFLVWLLAHCQAQPPYVYVGKKMKGANLVAPPQKPSDSTLGTLHADGGDWVAVVPYGFCRKDTPHFYWHGNPPPGRRQMGQWWGETPAGVAETIQMARAQGMKVMLKPHVWMMGGSHLDLAFEQEADWLSFEADYRGYVLHNAHLADSLGVDLLCITTELDRFALSRPAFWTKLIDDVRKVYKGKLTYAANWDRYPQLPFWNQLDYIGVDAYFPLSDATTPSEKAMVRGWKKPLAELEALSRKYQKPILFTEFGYRACNDAAARPWESETDCVPNPQAQANAYAALHEAVWGQPWFAGGFLWKWFMNDQHGHRERDSFSPQNKPAEAVLRRVWEGK
ncbi:glycoside hydrolase family 113 [Fibrella aestuarina]|uniref:glycoside hydrolase family 113 n=1 Tax=Fibrella aestuarina TaxID=651143 RepID=UPI00059D420F|nr:glycoside hydrolase TIM-barrel-like domain-containing protein [Fibrella aestuarina]